MTDWPAKWRARKIRVRPHGYAYLDEHGEPNYASPLIRMELAHNALVCHVDANDMVEFAEYEGEVLAGLILQAEKIERSRNPRSFVVAPGGVAEAASHVRVTGEVVDSLSGTRLPGTERVYSTLPMVLVDSEYPIAIETDAHTIGEVVSAEGELLLCDLEKAL